VPAQAVDEKIRSRVAGKAALEFLAIGGVGSQNSVGFGGQPSGRFFRGYETGDFSAIPAKKIRASFAGITATGDEDARSV
jgi:hypothetical protein